MCGHMQNRIYLPFKSTWDQPQFLVGYGSAQSLVFFDVSCVLLFICLSFSFLAMALSVYFRFMSLTVPLVSFAPQFIVYKTIWADGSQFNAWIEQIIGEQSTDGCYSTTRM